MNLLDVLLLVLLVVAVTGGLRVGLVARALGVIGLVAGALAATWTVPLVLGLVQNLAPAGRLFLGVGVLALTVAVCTTVGQSIGNRLRAGLSSTPLSGFDRVAGGLAGVAMVLGVFWFVLPAVSDVPGAIAREVRGSTVASMVRTMAPPPPDVMRALRSVVDSSRFPEVWADLRPAPVTGPPPEQIPVDATVVNHATNSTVGVQARGCGRRYEGSGVTLGEGTVITNAHVVAGADDVSVRRPDGARRPATIVVFDAERDLAVLEVSDLGQEALPTAPAQMGADGVSIGYPGGQATPRVAPLRVEEQRQALGRDIYGGAETEREVLFLSARLQQGDSGSPVLDDQGRVVGIVFAVSPDRPTTAYALDLSEVEAVLGAPRDPGESGRCIH